MYHALGLLAVAWQVDRGHARAATAGWLFLAGILCFSGSLYILTLGGIRWMGAVTPLGGVAFLVGWLVLAFGVRRTD
jgi:uncharacterized membrane protein YgdD (TMEM256/DUF423 family)